MVSGVCIGVGVWQGELVMFFLQLHVSKTNISGEHWTQSNLNSFFLYTNMLLLFIFSRIVISSTVTQTNFLLSFAFSHTVKESFLSLYF